MSTQTKIIILIIAAPLLLLLTVKSIKNVVKYYRNINSPDVNDRADSEFILPRIIGFVIYLIAAWFLLIRYVLL